MPAPQLSVRSARAISLAHMLAKRERRTVAQVVERALEIYARQAPVETSWAEFVARLDALPRDPDESDIDLDAVIRGHQVPHAGIDLT